MPINHVTFYTIEIIKKFYSEKKHEFVSIVNIDTIFHVRIFHIAPSLFRPARLFVLKWTRNHLNVNLSLYELKVIFKPLDTNDSHSNYSYYSTSGSQNTDVMQSLGHFFG